jgi:hypothetical protein
MNCTYVCRNRDCSDYEIPVVVTGQPIAHFVAWPVLVRQCGWLPSISAVNGNPIVEHAHEG